VDEDASLNSSNSRVKSENEEGMNKNQKIALGCGGAGCLGLIVVTVVCAFLWFNYGRRPTLSGTNTNRNYNINLNTNVNTNRTSPTNSNASAGSSSSMSDDDRHKLFQAAATSGDNELMARVMEKLGLNGTKQEENADFMKEHLIWVFKNSAFIKEINTQEKARAYVNEHIND
jgi:hypothetical protein